LLLNWPVVRLYLIESVGDSGRSHLAIIRRIFDLDPSLFPRFKALLLSDAPLPALTCELRTPPNAFLCPHHLPAPRGSLLCRFIMAVARLDKEIGGGVPNLPAAGGAAGATGLNTVPGSAGRYMSCLFETPEDEILVGEMLLRDVPLGAELGLFYQVSTRCVMRLLVRSRAASDCPCLKLSWQRVRRSRLKHAYRALH
jgi:hypothetical protein